MIEDTNKNNLFFVCSLIEYIVRKTKNEKKYIRPVRQAFNLDFYYKHYIKYSFS